MNKVAIYAAEKFSDEVVGFKPFECIATLPSRVIKAPVEGGAMSFDNKVRDPKTVKIIGKIELLEDGASNAVQTIRKMYANRNFSFYSVSTKDSYFDKMILQSAIDRTDKSEFDLVTYELEFVEAMIVQGSSKKSYDSANEDDMVSGFRAGVPISIM